MGARAPKSSRLALATPGAQRVRVHTLAAHQRADLAGLCTTVGRLQNVALVGVGKRAPARSWQHLAVG